MEIAIGACEEERTALKNLVVSVSEIILREMTGKK